MNAAVPFERRFAIALQLAEAGRLEAALAAFAALAGEAPAHVPTRRMLASLWQRGGRPADALREIDAALALQPRDAAIQRQRADLLLMLGRGADATTAARAACVLEPGAAANSIALAAALLAEQQVPEALDLLETSCATHAASLPLRRLLVRALLLARRRGDALARALDPTVLDDRETLGAVLADFGASGRGDEAATLLAARTERHPDDVEAWTALAAAEHGNGRASAAIAACERALALIPGLEAPREIRATALIDRGDVEAGLREYEALRTSGDAATAARHLVLMHYDPAQDNDTLYARHADFVARHLHVSAPPLARSARDPEKILRLGWLSPRFDAGPVPTFLEGLLRRFDRTRHRHVLIALQRPADAAGERLLALADERIDAAGLDDTRLLTRLRALELDVLVDLAGHATANRIGVVAQRVAPLQLCWLDWFDTTALPAMDVWLSDPWLTPEDSTQRYCERVLRLRSGRFCYTPPAESPPPDWNGRGEIVFGSFNRPAKFNADVVATWAELLRRLPQARLELGARAFDEPATRAHLAARFAALGIDPARLALHGQRSYADLLAAYRGIDIALDPFPFSGCTTTCDALWMGCATVALAGASFVSRQSAALLWRLGRSEWVADSPADYIERAVALAANAGTLRGARTPLRAQVQARLCDAATQAQEFAKLVRDAWRERCA